MITTGEGPGPSKCRPELDDGNLVTLARAFKETSNEFEYTVRRCQQDIVGLITI